MNACLKDCLKEVPETELIRRVVAGDDAAFETFYEKHRRQVYAVCFTATKKHEVAEDISQVVWSGVRRSLASFNGDCKVATFLQAITQHQIASYFRKEKRQNLASESLDAPKRYAPNPDNDENPREPKAGDPNLVGLVDRVDIERAIAKLPPQMRRIFVMKEVEGFEHNEIAQQLGIDEGTSKSMLFRAKEHLKKYLSNGRKA